MAGNHQQIFVLGAAGDLTADMPEGLKGYGNEKHWEESMKKINSRASLISPMCLFCCPCFVCQMLLGGGMKDYLHQRVRKVINDLNVLHYEGQTVFSNDGLKITFDRNKVPKDKLTKTQSGKLVVDKKMKMNQVAPVQSQPPAHQIPVQPVQMHQPIHQAYMHPQHVPVHQQVPMQQGQVHQIIIHPPQNLIQNQQMQQPQQHMYPQMQQPIHHQNMYQQNQVQYQQHGQPHQQHVQNYQNYQQAHARPQQQKQQIYLQTVQPSSQQVNGTMQMQQSNTIPTVATTAGGTIPTVATR